MLIPVLGMNNGLVVFKLRQIHERASFLLQLTTGYMKLYHEN